MKFDKETAIVVLICIVLIALWNAFYSAPQRQPVPAPVEQNTAVSQPEKMKIKALEKTEIKAVSAGEIKERVASISNDAAVFYFDSNGNISEIAVHGAKRTGSDENVIFHEFDGNEPFALTVPGWKFQGAEIESASGAVTVVQKFVSEEKTLNVRKTFTVSSGSSVLNCAVSFSGSAARLEQVLVWGGTISPLKYFSNDDLRDVHRVEYMLSASGKVVTSDPGVKKQEKFLKKRSDIPVRWIAVSNKYFMTQLYAASHPFNGGCDLVNHQDAGYSEPGIAGIYRNVPLPSEYNFTLYSGTKEIARLSTLPEDATKAIHLAYWGWLEPLCRPMLALLNFLKGITGSYGWAIILLTVLVKLVLWPLIHRGNKSMRHLQKVQPMIKELQAKYKNNPQELNQKMMELYRKEKVNPMGGCFPMLLQFPVFVALYSTLESSVELRHVPFLWAADLSRPDTVGPEILGFGIHPLILISTGLMVLQMRLSPQTGDPMQRKMMMFMPLIMLVFFYNFPSGLALYWTVNNILSILQMKFSQYAARKEETRASSGKNGSAKAV